MSISISSSDMQELEPQIHRVIKRDLGFSEPTLLSASINCIQSGADEDQTAKKLAGILDKSKASKLSKKIWEVVDEFCSQRNLPTSRKRPADNDDYPGGGAKKSKSSNGSTPETGTLAMTPEQIRSMMSNTLKQIQERKRALNHIQGGGPIPTPPVNHLDQTAEEKAQTIAALQAQISNRMAKVGIDKLPIPDRPTAVILDKEGRTVDASGQEITLAQHVPTLKANLRAKKRIEMKAHLQKPAAPTEEATFYDPRVALKGTVRSKRTIRFNEPGKFQAEGNRLRMKAKLEQLQAEISTVARKTGIQSATQLAKLVPKGSERDRIPEVEWWDQLILREPVYEAELKSEAITNLIEHPIQLQPLEPQDQIHAPVFLTKKERKKIRRQNRREAWKEKQDKIRLGLIDPDQPKVRMSNLMRVLGTEAVQDPTKVEAHVRAQMAKRLATHEKANADRKLTTEQKKEKMIRKIKEDTTCGVNVAVYRVRSLANQSKKFKVETNAKQLYMSGCIVIYEDVNVIVVEGGPKQQKKYKQLMLHRIKWNEEVYKDKEGKECDNKCDLVWEGQAKERAFGEIRIKMCPSESFAREHFKNCGVEHYWDQAYSCAVLEATEVV